MSEDEKEPVAEEKVKLVRLMPPPERIAGQQPPPITMEEARQLRLQEVVAISNLSVAVSQIANFLTGDGIANLLSGYARAQSVQAVLGGLAANAGRNSLDARTIKQNAVEIVSAVEACFSKFQETLDAKNRGEERDPELHDSEADYLEWKKNRDREDNR